MARSVRLSFLFSLLPYVLSISTLDRSYWEKVAKEDLEDALKTSLNTNKAKNVILFIGDGMGPNTIAASRIFRGGEESYLSFEKFPHIGIVKTYAADKQVPDSAATATALFTGVKINYGLLGLDPTVKLDDCEASLDESSHLTTLAAWAQAQGKATGIVTTTRLTHATPGAMYARSAQRDWECDTSLPPNAKRCKDIARQLIEDEPGKSFNVIMGGGRQAMVGNATSMPGDPLDLKWFCVREDGRNLMKEWIQDKQKQGVRWAAPTNTRTLLNVDTDRTDYLMGIFANSHFPFDDSRNKSEAGMPSLEQMTTTAIKVLANNKNGFVLMVEGGLIDLAHHRGKAKKAIYEVLRLNDAVNATMQLLEKRGIREETLVVVTSDHSHTLSISGYPERGNTVFGIAGVSKEDGMPFTTLSYANSGPFNYNYTVAENKSGVVRQDPSTVDTTDIEYGIQAAVLTDENTHGGNDITVFASGPFAHLFHRIHEQNYIATVIRYSARLGEYATTSPSSSPIMNSSLLLVILASIYCLIYTTR